MPIETYPGNVGSSPAKLQKPHTYDPSRQGLDDHRSLQQHREDDMDDCIDTTIIMTPNQFKEYVPVPPDFDAVFPEERIREIAAAFQQGFAAIARHPEPEDDEEKDAAGMLKPPLERDLTKLWAEITEIFNLCPGYFFHSSETTPDAGDATRLRIDASLISNSDKEDVVGKGPNWPLARLGVELKPGKRKYDAFENREDRPAETQTKSRRNVRGQTMSYANHTFAYQHRTKLFQLLLNGKEYRAMRWDRSGVIVTDNVNYVDDLAGTRLLLEFLYGFSQLSDAAQGLDHTAVRVKPGTCAWMRMEVLAFYHGDVDHKERSGVRSDELPANFAFPEHTSTAPTSPLFENGLLHHDPCAGCNPATDHHSTTLHPDPLPVWKYMRALFHDSLDHNFPRYMLTVKGRKYLVGKPIFEASGMVSRATRGYIALEWSTQRFVFLKDAWRPFYVGVDREGDVLSKLNAARVPYVPTLLAHEDVCEADGTEQETETSRYAPHASKNLRKTVQRKPRCGTASRKVIAPLPSRKSTTSSNNREAGPSSVNPKTPASASQHPQNTGPASHPASRGVKRTVEDVQAEDVAQQEGSGLRHLTHYRIIVAEVCLPSTAFTSGKQWVRIVSHCIRAHRAAYEDCEIIHRDVSVGNILIYPRYHTGSITRGGAVFWEGKLCDWELGKKITLDEARQPERTGTWQFMSLRCIRNPKLPVLLPDELESFSYAMLYNSMRFLLHDLNHIEGFIASFFDDSPFNGENNSSAPVGKGNMIEAGKLSFDGVNILFRDSNEDSKHPLNSLLNALLERFGARYEVLRWQAEVKKQEQIAAQLLLKPSATHDDAAEGDIHIDQFMDELGVEPEGRPSLWSTVKSTTTTDSAATTTSTTKAVPDRPPPEAFERAKSLDTHDAILELFERHLRSAEFQWPAPGRDLVGYDRLNGYRAQPRAMLCATKPAKQAKTVPDDKVLRHTPISVVPSAPGNKAKGATARGRNRAREPVSGR